MSFSKLKGLIAMQLPRLKPSLRDREYKQRSFNEISQIVQSWLFKDDAGHREMDGTILGIDPSYSKGFQSMGVLHFLGLKKEFKGIFSGLKPIQAIKYLEQDEQDFAFIIELLKNKEQDADLSLVAALSSVGEARDKNFKDNYQFRLAEMEHTQGVGNPASYRKEQGMLRAILFKGDTTSKCSICHRVFPTNIMVAAHIKPRSKCTTSERKNPNIVMPVCKVGCDDFFEKGYLVVGESGVITINEEVETSPELMAILRDVAGNLCESFSEKTAPFFEFKRTTL